MTGAGNGSLPDREVLVVTGAGGMGLAIARRLGPGRTIVLADRSAAALASAEAELTRNGQSVRTVEVDVSDRPAVEALAAKAAALGRLAAVVHTAGVSAARADAAAIYAVDLAGTAFVLDAFEPYAGPGTSVVCIASMAAEVFPASPELARAFAVTPADGLTSLPGLPEDAVTAYGTAKHGNRIRAAARAVAYGSRGARVNSVSPGMTATPQGEEELDGPSADLIRALVAASATRRMGTPEDVAAAVEFLCSPAASFVTGTDLLVDGGQAAGMRWGGSPGGAA